MPRPEWTEERAQEIDRRYAQICAFKDRFRKIFEESNDECARRLAREIAIDGDLTAIPAAHRLAVARQLMIVLVEAGMIDVELDEVDEHLRVIAKRLGLPFLEVSQAINAHMHSLDGARSDIDEWLAWAREHAPERLQALASEPPAARRKRRA